MTFSGLLATIVCLVIAGGIIYASVVVGEERRLARMKEGEPNGPPPRQTPILYCPCCGKRLRIGRVGSVKRIA